MRDRDVHLHRALCTARRRAKGAVLVSYPETGPESPRGCFPHFPESTRTHFCLSFISLYSQKLFQKVPISSVWALLCLFSLIVLIHGEQGQSLNSEIPTSLPSWLRKSENWRSLNSMQKQVTVSWFALKHPHIYHSFNKSHSFYKNIRHPTRTLFWGYSDQWDRYLPAGNTMQRRGTIIWMSDNILSQRTVTGCSSQGPADTSLNQTWKITGSRLGRMKSSWGWRCTVLERKAQKCLW